jgi:hypothetical protein
MSPPGGMGHERAGNSRKRARHERVNSPLEDLPDLVGLALADHQLEGVT